MMKRFNLHFSPDGDEVIETVPPATEEVPEGAPDWVAPRLSKLSQAKNAEKARADKAEADLKAITDKQEADKLKKMEEDGELTKVNEALTTKVAELEPFKAKYEVIEAGIRKAALESITEAVGEEDAEAYADFDTAKLQVVAQTIGKKAEAPAPLGDRIGERNADVNVAAAMKKYGSKANLARQNSELYDKLFPNPRRKGHRR
jgi:hypothetical protein